MHSPTEDPLVRQARREAIVAGWIWLGATAACWILCAFFAFPPLSAGETPPTVLGVPRWFALAVFVPWALCFVLSWWFALGVMREDDLGADHAVDLDADIRHGDPE